MTRVSLGRDVTDIKWLKREDPIGGDCESGHERVENTRKRSIRVAVFQFKVVINHHSE